MPGPHLTVLCRAVHTPYSGMLPGFLAGHYAYDKAGVVAVRQGKPQHQRLALSSLDDK